MSDATTQSVKFIAELPNPIPVKLPSSILSSELDKTPIKVFTCNPEIGAVSRVGYRVNGIDWGEESISFGDMLSLHLLGKQFSEFLITGNKITHVSVEVSGFRNDDITCIEGIAISPIVPVGGNQWYSKLTTPVFGFIGGDRMGNSNAIQFGRDGVTRTMMFDSVSSARLRDLCETGGWGAVLSCHGIIGITVPTSESDPDKYNHVLELARDRYV